MSQKRRARRTDRPNPREDRNFSNFSTQQFNKPSQFSEPTRVFKRKKVNLIPRNIVQEDYIAALEDPNIPIVVGTGPAGTGKTFLAALAGLKALEEGRCDKIVITRPNRAVDDKDIGFLPGDVFKKMMPWMLPVLDVFKEYYTPKEVEAMLLDEILEVCPIAYIRGRTFKNAFVMVDEAQGTTKNSMLSILTRIGEGSKMVVTGDIRQSDIGLHNGLQDFLDRFDGSRLIKVVNFTGKHVERSPVVSEVLRIYSELDF
ncbi:MAG: PhoH family protein [Richelia sp. RM2_1_2]|nr:PhoH family protein [Richelia sp. RM2_1_2]